MSIYEYKRHIKRILGKAGLDSRGFTTPRRDRHVSDHALDTAAVIRGLERKPAIIIHGVMPRSGTVYTGEILRLHPELGAYPNDVWEVPFLELTGDLMEVQEHFFQAYKQNRGKIGNNDFLPLFGASLIAHLYSYLPEGKRMLLKIPDVQYLNFFNVVFPYENIILLMRDGRDVVNSTVRTWPERKFSDVCRLWDYSARMILKYNKDNTDITNRYLSVKYEDVVRDPECFAINVCKHFMLDDKIYPYGRIQDISVRGSSTIKNEGKVTWKAVEKPNNFSSVGCWQNWSIKQKKIFKKIAGQTLIESGYCDDLQW